MAFGPQKQAFNLILWSQHSDKLLFKTAFWYVTLFKSTCAACGLHTSDYSILVEHLTSHTVISSQEMVSVYFTSKNFIHPRGANKSDVHIKTMKYKKKPLNNKTQIITKTQ